MRTLALTTVILASLAMAPPSWGVPPTHSQTTKVVVETTRPLEVVVETTRPDVETSDGQDTMGILWWTLEWLNARFGWIDQATMSIWYRR